MAAVADLPLLWRDDHLVAVYKPAGWLVHRTGLDAGETRFVVQALRDRLGQRVYPVHRLDKGTCGVLVMALHPEAARRMADAFARQAVRKRYLALVRGWAPDACEIDHPLRPEEAPADAPAQEARTRIRRLAQLELPERSDPRYIHTRASLVLAEPVTGRRHQIRRHLKHIAHPLIGDATHGKGALNRWWAQRLGLHRLWLHAWQLELPHPADGRRLVLHSGLQWPPRGAPPEPAFSDLQDWHGRVLRLPWQVEHRGRGGPVLPLSGTQAAATQGWMGDDAAQHAPARAERNTTMTEQRHARIRGQVHYREGDGPELRIPEGPVELHPSPDSMTLGWTTSDGSAGQAALTREQYRQYVEDGRIVLEDGGGKAGRAGR